MSALRPIFSFSKRTPIPDTYEQFEQLGSGSFSTVHRGEHKKTGDEVAIKTMNRRAISIKELRREVYIMREVCGHENIISLLDIYEEEKQIHLVLELVTGGELFDKIVEMEYYSESDAAKLIHQLIKIVQFLHTKNIVHRDLKPENLLFVDPSAEKMKLCDFGLADYMGKNVGLTGVVGSRTYMAPEILKMKTYGKPVDMYSIGVIMYILLCGYPPFEPEQGITDLEFPSPEWDKISDTAKKLIANLLAKDPNKRLTADQASAHRWILGETASSKPLTGSLRTLKKFNTHRKSGTTMERPKHNKASVFSVFEGIAEGEEITGAQSPREKASESTKSIESPRAPEAPKGDKDKDKDPKKKSDTSARKARPVAKLDELAPPDSTKLDPNRDDSPNSRNADRERRRKERRERRESNLTPSVPGATLATPLSPGDDVDKGNKVEKELRHQKALIEVLKREIDVLKKLLQEEEEYNAESRRKIKEELWKIQKDNQEERRKRTKLGRTIASVEERLDQIEKNLASLLHRKPIPPVCPPFLPTIQT